MYRIMLVDDEPLILAGIASMLNWEEYQCRIVGKASNGHQALSQLEELEPDIIITDIKMPGLDGIGFMKEAIERGSSAAFIVLTNLEEFALAREALRLGGVDYLVKLELDEEMLKKVLSKAIERCRLNRRKGLLEKGAELSKYTMEERVRNYFMRRLVYDVETQADESLTEEIRDRFSQVVLMLINFNYGFEGFSPTFTRDDQKKVMGFAENIISDMVKGFFENSCLLRRDQNGLVLVLSLSGDQESYEERIQVMSRKFRQVVKDYFEVPISIAVSQKGGEIQDLLYQAMSAMNYTYYESSENVVFYSEKCEENRRHSSNFNINFLKKELSGAVRQNDSKGFLNIMNQVIQLFGECMPAKTQAINGCGNLYYFILSLIEDQDERLFPYVVDIVGHLNRMESLESILRWLEGFRDEVVRVLEARGEFKVGRNVELVQKYIKEHCQEKITLGQMAGILNISQGYLSSVFKKQTGKKFSDYVTEVKIGKAMELIETHQYTMYEISNMLAFDTQYYFSTVFKKITGYTPKEYENMTIQKKLL